DLGRGHTVGMRKVVAERIRGEAPVSRRERFRQFTIAEIKQEAARQLAEQGAAGLSLRAVARELGMVSSALYRYFASRDELITALCVDAYTSAADALVIARDELPADDHAGRWLAVCHAYRTWALHNTSQFALIFGTPIPGYQAPENITGPPAA